MWFKRDWFHTQKTKVHEVFTQKEDTSFQKTYTNGKVACSNTLEASI